MRKVYPESVCQNMQFQKLAMYGVGNATDAGQCPVTQRARCLSRPLKPRGLLVFDTVQHLEDATEVIVHVASSVNSKDVDLLTFMRPLYYFVVIFLV